MVGTTYVRTVIDAGGKPRFYQDEFGAAVMSACGRGYVNPDRGSIPGLQAFLDVEVDTFHCEQLPPVVATLPLSPMQRAFRYQEMAVALTWKLVGLSWRGLAPLYGLLFGLTAAISYGLLRTAMRPLLAAIGGIALVGSTIQLIYLPHLRDYSKAPFLLAAILCLAWIVRRPMRPTHLVAVGAGYGLLVGLGVGFRNDLLIALPPFILALLVFLPGGVFEQWRPKVATIGACVASLWLAMWPMRAIYSPGGGNSMQHVLVLGLGEPFNHDLGVNNGGLYGWGYEFKDEYAHALASSYATRMWNADHALELYGPEYDRASTAYLRAVVTQFPADMLVRVYAAVIRTLALPYTTTSLQPPTLLQDARVVRGYHARERLLRAVGAWWPWTIVLAIVGLTIHDPRLAAFIVMVSFYFAAYPVLQFNERHAFHLEIIAWWCMGLVVDRAISLIASAKDASARSAWLDGWRGRKWVGPLRRALIAAATIAIIVIVPLWALRHYQSEQIETQLQRYLGLERAALTRETVAGAGGLVRLASPARALAVADSGNDAVQSGYVVVELAAGACEALKFDLTFRYAASSPAYDFSRTIQVRPPIAAGGVRHIFFPIYAHPRRSSVIDAEYTFKGIDLPAENVSCVSELSWVRNVRGLPLLLDLNLPAGWQDATLYQTVDGLEARRNGEPQPEVYTFPPDLPVGRSLVVRDIVALAAADIEQQSPTLKIRANEWVVEGAGGIGGRGPFLYLAQMRAKPAKTR